MPENINFNEIPVDIRTPGQFIEIDNSRALKGLPTQGRRLLIMGQRLTAGTVAQAVPTRISSAAEAINYFGRGSQLANMVAAAKAANAYTEMWAVALDDNAAGVAAAHTVTLSGVVAAAGTLRLYVGGVRVEAGVAAGEANSATATKLAAAINANLDLPVTAAAVGAVVTITCRHKGEMGSALDLRVNYYSDDASPVGLVSVIAQTVAGTGNPDVLTAFASLGGDQYYSIVSGWSDVSNLTKCEAEMSTRWGPMAQRTGHVFAGVSGTYGTLAALGAARNSPHTTLIGAKKVPTSPWILASVLGAVCEFHGAIDPARPFQTLALPGVLSPSITDRFTLEERNLLLRDGISTFTVDPDGTLRIERVITTYQTNAFGIEDISYLDLETKWTVDYIRYAVRARIALRYPRFKLADDGTQFAAGQAIVTPRAIRAELFGLFRELEEVGLVENFDQFKNDLIVVRSAADPNRVNAVIPPDVVNQFRVFAAAVQFRL